jgi:citrate lyase acyl carrier protein
MECGNHKKSDVVVTMRRNQGNENSVVIRSKYHKLFGENIAKTVDAFIEKTNIKGVDITIEDYGAWEYTLMARLEACLAILEGERNDS